MVAKESQRIYSWEKLGTIPWPPEAYRGRDNSLWSQCNGDHLSRNRLLQCGFCDMSSTSSIISSPHLTPQAKVFRLTAERTEIRREDQRDSSYSAVSMMFFLDRLHKSRDETCDRMKSCDVLSASHQAQLIDFRKIASFSAFFTHFLAAITTFLWILDVQAYQQFVVNWYRHHR